MDYISYMRRPLGKRNRRLPDVPSYLSITCILEANALVSWVPPRYLPLTLPVLLMSVFTAQMSTLEGYESLVTGVCYEVMPADRFNRGK